MSDIKTLRRLRGWTQTMLEAATNHRVSAGTISRIERSEVIPERRTREDLAAALQVRVEGITWPLPHQAGEPPDQTPLR